MPVDPSVPGRPPTHDGLTVLLVGASGFLGRHLQAAFEAQGHVVRPMSRRHGADLRQLQTPAQWQARLDGIQAVVNAAGILVEQDSQTFAAVHTGAPVALFQACAQRGLARVVQISALAADAQADTGFLRSKGLADAALLQTLPGGWVLRPGLVHGADGGSARWLLRLARSPVLPLVGDGQQLLQPIHVDDVVDACRVALQQPADGAARRCIELVGPETLSWADWLQRLRRAQGLRPARRLSLPRPLVRTALRALHGINPLLHPDNLRMLDASRLGRSSDFAEFVGRPPRHADAASAGASAAC